MHRFTCLFWCTLYLFGVYVVYFIAESAEVNETVIRNRASYAEVITRLRIVAVQRLDQVKKTFDERKLAWRKLRHERALAQYFEKVKATDYVAPPRRRAIFNEMKKIQKLANSQCFHKLRQLGAEVVPRLKGDWV
jgi:hypothetical protein